MLPTPLKALHRWVQKHKSLLKKLALLLVVVLVVARQAGWASAPVVVRLPSLGPQAAAARALYYKFKFDTSMRWPDQYTLRGSLLTPSVGPHRGKQLASIDDLRYYDSDPRLVWSVYLDHAMNEAQTFQHEATRPGQEAEMDRPPTLPFSWYDWADHHDFNKLIAAMQDGGVSLACPFLYERAFNIDKLQEVEAAVGGHLFDYQRTKYLDPEWYRKIRAERPGPDKVPENQCRHVAEGARFNLPFEVHELHEDVRPEVYQMQARSFIFSKLPNPLSVTMLEADRSAYRFPVRSARSNLVESRILEGFLSRHMTRADEQADFRFDHVATMREFLNSDAAFKARVMIPDAQRTQDDESSIALKPSDFEFDVRGKIKELEQLKTDKKIGAHQAQYLESLKTSIATHPALAPKYLSEAEHISQFAGMGYHRDKRFFNGGLVEEFQEYQARLNSLVRTWLKFARANGLITWVAHGSLYGYVYNAKNFPWDNDYDVQMPIRHLHLLSEYFNQSLVLEDPREGNGKYLVDVGTSITVRTNGNGQNNIDARFVDIDSGLYVDVTGLSVSSNPQRDNFKSWYERKARSVDVKEGMKKFQSPEVGDGLAAMNVSALEQYSKEHQAEFTEQQRGWIKKTAASEKEGFERRDAPQRGLSPAQRYYMNRQVGAYNCRNNHFITMELASPLVKTVYHGVEALVPYRVIDVLRKEYYVPKDLGFTTYQGNVYVPELRSWFNLNILKRFANMRSWNANLREVKSPLNDLKLADLDPLFENMHTIGYTDLFSLYYTSFNLTAYRLKELELQYDTVDTNDDKEDLLEVLRNGIIPSMDSPAKDPTLYMYEKRMWEELAQTMTGNEVKRITQEVSYGVYKRLLAAASDLYNKKFALFAVTDDSGEPYDFNHLGTEIPKENKLFESDYPDGRR